MACNDATTTATENSTVTIRKDKPISSRNYSINRSNSYNDLFLDSMSLENFVADKKIPDSLADRIRSFYNARNYQFAWFSGDGLTEQALGFWNLYNHYLASTKDTSLNNKILRKTMSKLVAEDSLFPDAKNKTIFNTEIMLTVQFIRHTLMAYEPEYVKRKEMERFVPALKQDPVALVDSLINKKHKDDKYYEDANVTYGLLKDQLKIYYDIYKNGGWPHVDGKSKSFKKGMKAPEISSLKKRLQLTGDMQGQDSTQFFSDSTQSGVKNFQRRHGLTPTGIVDNQTLQELNVPALQRIKQILINMDRARWLPQQQDGNMIIVNIPAFTLHVMDGKDEVFNMDVVVGKEGHNTRIFTGTLSQVVFNPSWKIPGNIVEKEILPEVEKDPDYLEKEDMEITGKTEDGLPEIRQKPGPKNALGKIKFLFPNSYDIYFHDTPAKGLFKKDKRAFSHGCIRLSKPVQLAQYLLRDQRGWDLSKIKKAMASEEEKPVPLKKPVLVLITYYTTWVDEKGILNFREDIYDHDLELSRKMFIDGVNGDDMLVKKSSIKP
jgi:L,D-transpeptidase YcbB